MNFLRIGICLAWLSLVTSTFAQLEWEQKLIDVKASPADTHALAHFEFKNVGEKAVTINSVKSSCGCTTVELGKKIYDPGEKGEIVANFEFKERVGQQEKTILVSSDDLKEPNVALTLKVYIPELVKITPGTIAWENGEDKISKSARVELLEEKKVKINTVHTSNPKMQVQLKEITPKKEYEVVITPENTGEPSVSVIQLEGEVDGEKKTFPVYAQIRGKTNTYGYGTALPQKESSSDQPLQGSAKPSSLQSK